MEGVAPSEFFFKIFDAKSRVWRQFGPENKLIEGQPNEYDVICRNASVLAFQLWPTIFAGAPKYLLERRSTAFPRHYTPGHMGSHSRGDVPAFTPTEAGTQFSDPGGMQGWADLVGWLHTKMVYPPEDGHPSKY